MLFVRGSMLHLRHKREGSPRIGSIQDMDRLRARSTALSVIELFVASHIIEGCFFYTARLSFGLAGGLVSLWGLDPGFTTSEMEWN